MQKRQTIFWHIVEVAFNWRRFITIITSIVLLISIVVSFLLPKEYKATAKILPSLKNDLFSMLGATNLGNLAKDFAPLVGARNLTSGGYNCLAILNSRRCYQMLIEEFDLIKIYDISDSSMEKTIRKLQDNLDFVLDEYGTIEISVFDRDPTRAANMANSLVRILNGIISELGTQDARNNREFIEKRLQTSKINLAHAEDSLRKFQELTGMILTSDQSSTISAIAELYVMKEKKEIEVAILEKNVTPDNQELYQLKLELGEIAKKLAGIPQIGLESYRLYRNMAINQKIVEFLMPLYEQAKLQEAKDTPSVLVLDKSVPPERKTRPLRILIIISGFFIGIVSTLTISLLIENGVIMDADPHTLKYHCKQLSLYCKNRSCSVNKQ